MFKYVSTLLFFYSTFINAQSIGTGADGNCVFNPGDNFTKTIYNCESVVIAAGATIGAPGITSAIELRSRSTITVTGNINLSASGRTAIAGGGNGADCGNGANDLCTLQNAPGTLGGEGRGATRATDTGGTTPAGGGGSGGSFAATASNGTAGSASSGGTAGAPGTAPAGYGNVNNFNTSILAGVGGGGGSSGDDNGTIERGGDGGGGGGAISLIASGAVSVAGTISVNGGNGLAPTSNGGSTIGGGGGGGSGGAIYIVSSTSVSITGNLNSQGGNGAAGPTTGLETGGNGGNGSIGFIRVDSPGGAFGGGGTSNPAANQFTSPALTDPLLSGTNNLNEFTSDIDYACAARAFENYRPFLYNIFLGAFLSLAFFRLSRIITRARFF